MSQDNCVNYMGQHHIGHYEQFKTALEAYDYLEKLNFQSGKIGDYSMPYDERLKFCRWINGVRCLNYNVILLPGLKGLELEYEKT